MSEEGDKIVSIIFRTPAGDETGLHERRLHSVPESLAGQMAVDFAEHGDPESQVSQYQLYRIEGNEDERLLALDFGEVMSIMVGQPAQ